MQIETLKVFCDLIETRSFSQAAIRNYITQSAVSQQIKTLETRFDTPLVRRSGRLVLPTDAGRILYSGAREILDRFSQVQADVSSIGAELSGPLRVATIYSVGLYELTGPIKNFLKNHPKVRLHIEYHAAIRVYEDVLTGSCDVGIVTYPKARKGIQVIGLPADRLILICAPEHPLAGQKQIEIRHLQGYDFVAFERGVPSRQAIDEILHEHGVEVRTAREFDNIETIKRAVEIGAGLSIVPLHSVQRETQNGSLVQLEFKEGDFFRPLGALVRGRQVLGSAANKFLELLQNRDES
jgi:LysR family transcriptional regulator, transcriptional activator of the cysJI operon